MPYLGIPGHVRVQVSVEESPTVSKAIDLVYTTIETLPSIPDVKSILPGWTREWLTASFLNEIKSCHKMGFELSGNGLPDFPKG